MTYNTEVFCSIQIEGMHCWANCPHEEVAYLRAFHRHMFHIKCYANVEHDDRDIEFIMLKHKVRHHIEYNYYDDMLMCCNFGGMSCEMIAKELIGELNLSKCEVSEDGENGAVVSVEK